MKRIASIMAAALCALGVAACDWTGPKSAGKPASSAASAPQPTAQPAPPPAEKSAALPGSPASDAVLSDKVKSALVSSPGLNAQGVDVTAADGVVTLYGTVDVRSEKDRIALLAMSVDGVRSVVNNVVVVSGS